jgi:hypothetical protein
VEDWNYQKDFKLKRKEEERLAEMAAAHHENQVNTRRRFLSKEFPDCTSETIQARPFLVLNFLYFLETV